MTEKELTEGNYNAKIKKSTNCYGVYYYTVTVTNNVQGREDFIELKSYQTEKAAIKGANKILASYRQS
jgi:hypothetical protein